MKKKILFLLFTLTFLFVSCTTVYLPTEVNTPMFRDEHRVTAGLSIGAYGVSLQTGYSLTKHFAVIADGSYLNQKSVDNEDFLRFGELGIGYYKILDKSKLVSFEIYGGAGFAYARSKDVRYDYLEEGNYNKIFLQPDFALFFGGIDMIFACKMSVIKFTSYSYSQHNENLITGEPSALELEPAFTLRFGSPNFKIRIQIGTSAIGNLDGPVFGRRRLYSALGAVFQF
jgi:hypothetical protein